MGQEVSPVELQTVQNLTTDFRNISWYIKTDKEMQQDKEEQIIIPKIVIFA